MGNYPKKPNAEIAANTHESVRFSAAYKTLNRFALLTASLMISNHTFAAGNCGSDDHCACALDNGGVRVILDDGSTHADPRFYVGKGSGTGLYHANVTPTTTDGTEYSFDSTSYDYSGDQVHYNIWANPTWHPGAGGGNYQYETYSSLVSCASFDNQAPTASFTVSCDTAGDCSVDGSGSSDADGSISSYAWDCDNDGSYDDATGSTATCSFETIGDKTIGLQVTDNESATGDITATASVDAVKPTVTFSVVCNYLTCNFDATSVDEDQAAVTYSWDFGDSSGSSTDEDPQYTYAAGGTYTVSVTATDADSQTDTESNSTGSIAANVGPTAGFSVSCSQHSCTFTNTSSDSDGSIAGSSWDFGDGNGTSTETSPTYDYSSAGSYTVTLYVSDDQGESDNTTGTAAPVDNVNPTASFTVSCSGLVCDVDATASSDSDGTVDQYSWNWGDGNSSAGSTTSHTYSADGSYSIALTVTDNSFGSGSTSSDVTVEQPVVDTLTMEYDPVSGNVIHTVVYDEDHGVSPYSAPKIFIGTGTCSGLHTANVSMTNAGDNRTFTYSDSYAYSTSQTVCSRVFSDNSAMHRLPGPDDATYETWTYQTVAPNNAPTATASVNTNPCDTAGTTCIFTGSGSDNDGTIASYSWDFGDGNTSNSQNPSHEYAANGDYSVTLTVTDDDGASSTDTLTVTVDGPPPPPPVYPNFAYSPGADSLTFTVNDTDCGTGTLNYGVNAASSTNSQDMYGTGATDEGDHRQFILTGLSPDDTVNFNFDLGTCTDSGELSYTVPNVVDLYSSLDTNSERYVADYQEYDANGCLVSEYGDRVHFRHAKSLNEMNYHAIETSYWLVRTASIRFIDCTTATPPVSSLTIEVTSQGKLNGKEFRNFFEGSDGKLEKWENTMPDPGFDPDPSFGVQTNEETGVADVEKRVYTITKHPTANNRDLAIGDTMEFEMNYDLNGQRAPGREIYYLSQNLYKFGTGIVPWTMKDRFPGSDNTLFTADDEFTPVFDLDGTWNGFNGNSTFKRDAQGNFPTDVEVEWDSVEITDSKALVAGDFTMNEIWSGEENQAFKQFAPTLSGDNVREWSRGRRVFHTSARNSSHHENTFSGQEDNSNPNFPWFDDKIEAQYINDSCADCHRNNGASPVPEIGQVIDGFVFKFDNHDLVGNALQPTMINRSGGSTVRIDVRDDPDVAANFSGWTVPQAITSDEGTVKIASIDVAETVTVGSDSHELVEYTYEFSNSALQSEYVAGTLDMSVRRSPRLVGMGLKDAVKESDIQYNEANQATGLSGRVRTVTDPETSDKRIGRFGYKGGQASLRHQIAAALLVDMGMPNHIYNNPDCGALQTNCATAADRFAYDVTSGDGVTPYDSETSDDRLGQPATGFPAGGYGNGSSGSNRTTYSNGHEANYFEDLTRYMALLAPPPQRVDGFHVRTSAGNPGPSDFTTAANIAAGATEFNNIGCGGCHKEGPQGAGSFYTTSDNHPYPELRGQKFIAYTDFLLHDMGEGLADTLGEGDPAEGGATGSEWMTPSLLGVGYQKCVTGKFGRWLNPNEWFEGPPPQAPSVSDYASNYCVPSENYLHDGRARTLEEAILWHGGEGAASRDAWKALSKTKRDQVIDFLKSL